MGLFRKLFGICDTPLPQDQACWKLDGGKVKIDLSKAPELSSQGGAVRLEDGGLPNRLLIFKGDDQKFYAFVNKCTHGGRRLDHKEGKIRCCSIGQSTFTYDGKMMSGSAKSPITPLAVEETDGKLVIALAAP